jgi:hypothetical protein
VFVHPLGDWHIGHENCDLHFIEQQINAIPAGDTRHRILLMGDLLDIGIKTAIGGSVYDQRMTLDESINYTFNILSLRAKQIDGIVEGNHEWRLYKECGIDITKLIADRLGVPYLKHSGVITYAFNKRAYNINMFHGKVGGSIENALRAVKAMANKVFADVYLMAHCHHCAATHRQFKVVDSRNGKVVECTQHFVLTGHSLDYDDSYADQMNLEISTKGFPTIILHGETPYKKIDVLTT